VQIEFNNRNDNKKNVSKISSGDYASMLKLRKETLSKIQDGIQDMLKDYDGQSITIIIQHEDENGMPDHTHVLMAGVGRLESQIAMGKALSDGADQVLELLMESTKGDTKAMLKLANAMMNTINHDKRKK
jgi:ribosomal protein L21E